MRFRMIAAGLLACAMAAPAQEAKPPAAGYKLTAEQKVEALTLLRELDNLRANRANLQNLWTRTNEAVKDAEQKAREMEAALQKAHECPACLLDPNTLEFKPAPGPPVAAPKPGNGAGKQE